MKNHFKGLALTAIISGCSGGPNVKDMMVDVKLHTTFDITKKTDPFTKITTISSSETTREIYYNGYGERTGESSSSLTNTPILKGIAKIHPNGKREYLFSISLLSSYDGADAHYSRACEDDNEITFSADEDVVGPIPGEFYELDTI